MKPWSPIATVGVVAVFFAGFFSHLLYQRWNPDAPPAANETAEHASSTLQGTPPPPQSHTVSFAPWSAQGTLPKELPAVPARDVDRIRALAGTPARVRGRVFRVGHSSKSNTHFLNFGPSRESLTAVIFASALELFQKKHLPLKNLTGREVEITGEIKDHPQYGLEIILESPAQLKVLD